MKTMQVNNQPLLKTIRCNSSFDYYCSFYRVLNPLLHPITLTDSNINVLSAALVANDHIGSEFSTSARKIIKNMLNITNSGLSNILRDLREKNINQTDEFGQIKIVKRFVPVSDNIFLIQIRIKNEASS